MSADRTGLNAPFTLRAVAIMVAVALIGFVSYVVLTAYGDKFKPTNNGGTHALSTSAVGFLGISELVRMTHGQVGLVRKKDDIYTSGLLIVTPGDSVEPGAVKRIVDQRNEESLPTLIVLPKWNAARLAARPAWVNAQGTLPPFFINLWLRDIVEDATIVDGSGPNGLRTIRGSKLHTVLQAPDGGALVAGIDDTTTYILADPDVLNNMGIKTPAGAERALNLLESLTPEDEGITFEGSVAGLGNDPNLLKLAFEPPFLPLTLCIVFAALLAGWHAMVRFGPPSHERRKVAFGKRAIVENGAALLRLAGRRHRTGERYAQLTREAAAAATGAPHGLTGEALDAYLDRLNREGEPFTHIAERAATASDTRRLLAAARDLYHWKRTVTREH